MRRTVFFTLIIATLPVLVSCSGMKNNGNGNNPPPPASGVTVTPASMNLNKGGMQAFSATVSGVTDQSVFWGIVGATPQNGDATHGFISNAGVYIAPTTVPNPPTITIKALSVADLTKSGTATITLQAGSNTSVSVSPVSNQVTTFGSLQFSANVTGNANTAVTWQVNGVAGGGPTTGAISASGLFVAPNSVPVLTNGNNGGQTSQVVVTAVSQADSAASDSVLVTIVPPQQSAQAAPSPLGVSGSSSKDVATTGGVTACCGGTLGSLVSRGTNPMNLYILSNNHVMAGSDSGTAGPPGTGDPIVQPGLIDNNCSVPPAVATLSQFFNLEKGSASTDVDAALALINSGAIDPTGTILQLGGTNTNNLPTNGPPHQGTGVAAAIGQMVAKSGRSTGITCSTVFALNSSFSVEYQKGCTTGSTFSASYSNQVDITNNGFSAEGDSGSLIVTQSTADPIGLFFAGSVTDSLANPISQVLSSLPDPNNPQSTPVFVGTAQTHQVAACSLPGPQSAIGASLSLQKVVASSEALGQATTVRDAHGPELMAHPEVQALGVGASYDNPAEPAILLFVTRGQPRSNLPVQLDGVRTRIIEGEFTLKGSLSAEDSANLEQSAAAPQLVYPVSDSEVARAKPIHAAHVDEWMKKPGVQGFGIGSSVDSPGEAALVIFLIKGMAHDPIPPVIDGMRMRVRESTRFRAGVGQGGPRRGCSSPAASQTQPRVAGMAAPSKP